MLKLLFLLLSFLSLTAARVIPYPEPYYQPRTFDLLEIAFVEELFNSTELISLPDWQWPQLMLPELPVLPQLPVHFFTQFGKAIRNIVTFLQGPTTSLFNAVANNFQQRKKKPPAHSKPFNFFKPLQNFSFTFGFSLNLGTSGSIGFARMQAYNVVT